MNSPAFQFDPESARFGASRSQKRIEDARLVAGRGLFSDDRTLPGELWLVVVRSPHAHARIGSIDASAAKAAPGVVAVWSNADLKADGVGAIPHPPLFKRADGSPMAIAPRYPLADDAARYVGQPVAAVVAATRRQAQDAAEQVAVEYEELPCVTDARRAIEPGAPQIWPDAPGNVCAESRFGDPAAVDAAIAGAAHVVKVSLHNQRLAAFPLEPRAAIATHADGRTTLYTQTQQPTGTRDLLGATFGAKPDTFRIVNGDIGGGFGMKTGLMPEDALICYAARKLGRPVRWRADRSEDFLAAHMGRDQHFDATLALDAEGRILALRTRVLGNFGGHAVGSTAMIPLMVGPKVVPSVYRVPAIDLHIRGVTTNTMSTGAYRGAGRPESIFLMERLLGKAAHATGLGPVEIRRRNFIPPDAMPHRTTVGEVYDSGEFAKVMDQALARADWDGFAARKAESARRGKLRGRGLSTYLEWTGALLTETADVRIGADGTVTVFSGTQAMGQGLETTYVQLVAEVLEIDTARIRIVQGDTDQANGVGSVGSRSAFIGGSAIVMAGHKVVDDGRNLAAQALEAAARRRRVQGGKVPDRRHRPRHRSLRARRPAAGQAHPLLRHRQSVRPVVAERRPGVRGGDRPGDRRGRGGPPHHRRRRRPHHQPHDRHRADPRRDRAGRRPGPLRSRAIRPRERPARHRLAHGLRHPARRSAADARLGFRRDGAVPDEPARGERLRRARHDRRGAGDGARRARRARRRGPGDAAHRGEGLARAGCAR